MLKQDQRGPAPAGPLFLINKRDHTPTGKLFKDAVISSDQAYVPGQNFLTIQGCVFRVCIEPSEILPCFFTKFSHFVSCIAIHRVSTVKCGLRVVLTIVVNMNAFNMDKLDGGRGFGYLTFGEGTPRGKVHTGSLNCKSLRWLSTTKFRTIILSGIGRHSAPGRQDFCFSL